MLRPSSVWSLAANRGINCVELQRGTRCCARWSLWPVASLTPSSRCPHGVLISQGRVCGICHKAARPTQDEIEAMPAPAPENPEDRALDQIAFFRGWLEAHPNVGQVRGLGLLQAVEFVKDKATREPFPKESGIAEKIRQAALEKNVLTYPTQGCVDGLRGDHILLAPPFIITAEESKLIADAIQYALNKVFFA